MTFDQREQFGKKTELRFIEHINDFSINYKLKWNDISDHNRSLGDFCIIGSTIHLIECKYLSKDGIFKISKKCLEAIPDDYPEKSSSLLDSLICRQWFFLGNDRTSTEEDSIVSAHSLKKFIKSGLELKIIDEIKLDSGSPGYSLSISKIDASKSLKFFFSSQFELKKNT